MKNILQLGQLEFESNALSVLYKALMTELGESTLAIISAVNLDQGTYQISAFCNEIFCPVYSPEQLLKPAAGSTKYSVNFIQQWKQNYRGSFVTRDDTPELFKYEFSEYDQALVIPISHDGLLERWLVVLKSQKPLDSIELEKLLLIANLVFSNIARVEEKRELTQANKWIDRELEEIANLQSLLLPEEHKINIAGVEVAFVYRPYREASGDYFDITSIQNSDPQIAEDGEDMGKPCAFGCVIADVSGHGPSAAFEGAMLDAILRTFDDRNSPDQHDRRPASIIEYVNKHFFTKQLRGKFITANMFYYEANTRLLRYTSAGHPNSYVKRQGAPLISLDQSAGIPIGVVKDQQWSNGEIELLQGDILFMYTDVVLETRNQQGDEFGTERLKSVLISAEKNPHCVVSDVENALYAFNGGQDLSDDLTLCAVEIKA